MPGIVVRNGGTNYSYTNEQYTAIQGGTHHLYVKGANGAIVTFPLTSNTSASLYCKFKVRVANKDCYLAKKDQVNYQVLSTSTDYYYTPVTTATYYSTQTTATLTAYYDTTSSRKSTSGYSTSTVFQTTAFAQSQYVANGVVNYTLMTGATIYTSAAAGGIGATSVLSISRNGNHVKATKKTNQTAVSGSTSVYSISKSTQWLISQTYNTTVNVNTIKTWQRTTGAKYTTLAYKSTWVPTNIVDNLIVSLTYINKGVKASLSFSAKKSTFKILEQVPLTRSSLYNVANYSTKVTGYGTKKVATRYGVSQQYTNSTKTYIANTSSWSNNINM